MQTLSPSVAKVFAVHSVDAVSALLTDGYPDSAAYGPGAPPSLQGHHGY